MQKHFRKGIECSPTTELGSEIFQRHSNVNGNREEKSAKEVEGQRMEETMLSSSLGRMISCWLIHFLHSFQCFNDNINTFYEMFKSVQLRAVSKVKQITSFRILALLLSSKMHQNFSTAVN